MRRVTITIIALAGLAALAGCEGRTDENLQNAASEQLDEVVNETEALTEDAGNALRDVGNSVENVASDIGNEIDPGRPDGDDSKADNKQ